MTTLTRVEGGPSLAVSGQGAAPPGPPSPNNKHWLKHALELVTAIIAGTIGKFIADIFYGDR